MNLIKQGEAAKIAGVSRQAIFKMKEVGKRNFFVNGKVDIDSKEWKDYLSENNKLNRKNFNKNLITKESEVKLEKNSRVFNIKIICGVYFLLQNDEIVYIGKSIDIERRVNEHKNYKKFNKYKIIEVEKSKMSTVERHFINKYLPKYNKDADTMLIKNILKQYN